MLRKTYLLVGAGWLGLLLHLPAQEVPETDAGKDKAKDEEKASKATEASGPHRFWQATLSGGHYMVALDQISSVSRHKFLLDGAIIVDEVTVDTVGQVLARFYFITPATEGAPGNVSSQVTSRARDLANRGAQALGSDLQNMVVKTYPGTTHARSVEYRVLTEQDLTALYTSVQAAWESGRGRKFMVR